MNVFGFIGEQLLQVVLPGIGTVAAGLAVALLKKQLAKVGLDVSEKQETRIRQVVHDAIVRTEEAARRDPTMTSADKAEYTERTVREKMPELPPAVTRDMIDALLPIIRSRGIDAKAGKVIPLQPVPATPATFGKKTN